MDARGLYKHVGHHIFAVDTVKLAKTRVKSAAAARKTKTHAVVRDEANGPIIIDHSASQYDGLTYCYPKNFYCPLRGTKADQSKAQSIFGGHRSEAVRFRNPKSYTKKHGDMTQKIPVRRADTHAHERYLGSDAYAQMYKTMEIEAFAIKNCVTMPSGKVILREPKEMQAKPPKPLRLDPTEYKQSFQECQVPKQPAAGLLLAVTNIGQW